MWNVGLGVLKSLGLSDFGTFGHFEAMRVWDFRTAEFGICWTLELWGFGTLGRWECSTSRLLDSWIFGLWDF